MVTEGPGSLVMLSSPLDTPEVTVTVEAREGLGMGIGDWSRVSVLKVTVAETLGTAPAWSGDADVLVRAPGGQVPDTVTTGGAETPGAWSRDSRDSTLAIVRLGGRGEPETVVTVAETLGPGAWSRDADVLVSAPGRHVPDIVTTGGETLGAWSRDTLAIVRLGGRGEPETVVTVASARDLGVE